MYQVALLGSSSSLFVLELYPMKQFLFPGRKEQSQSVTASRNMNMKEERNETKKKRKNDLKE